MIITGNASLIKDYYERIDLNQSSLKVIINDGIQFFMTNQDKLSKQDDLYYEEKRHFIIGQAVDTYITQGKNVFEENYYVSRLIKKPSDTIMSICKMTFDKVLADFITNTGSMDNFNPYIDDELIEPILQNSIISHDYYSNWKMETKIASVIKDGKMYWEDLIASNGKQVLSEDENKVITAIVSSLLNHTHTSGLFLDNNDIDIIYQLPLYFKYLNVPCKALLDMVIVNHKQKRIYPIDLKTLGDYVLRFNKTVLKRRYDVQGAFYTEAISQNINNVLGMCSENTGNYSIANFAFIVESTTTPGTPMVFVLSSDLLNVGKYGDNEKELLGFHQGVVLYQRWKDSNFSLEQYFSNTKGVIFIEPDFKYDKIV